MKIASCTTGFAGIVASAAAMALSSSAMSALATVTQTSPYTSIADSTLFSASYLRPGVDYFLEDFEDGLMNTEGLLGPPGDSVVLGPSPTTDSVEPGGSSLSGNTGSISLIFDGMALGGYPTKAGFVFTDSGTLAGANLTITVLDANGFSAGIFNYSVGDGLDDGGTAEDRFFAIELAEGISTVLLNVAGPTIEIDDVQYANPVPALRPLSDLNADGLGDLLVRTPTGLDAWLLDGNGVVSSPNVLTGMSSGWKVVGVGDLDGDFDGDVIWRNAGTQQVAVWIMNNAAIESAVVLSSISSPWDVVGVGDLDGNGKADILWWNKTSGAVAAWLMNGSTIDSTAVVATGILGSQYLLQGVADLDRDGTADVVLRKLATSEIRYWKIVNTAINSEGSILTGVGSAWAVQTLGDLDADGDADIVWRNTSTGAVAFWLLENFAITTSAAHPSLINTAWKIVGATDANGDGKADVIWHRASTGQAAIWFMDGAAQDSGLNLPNTPIGSALLAN